MPRARNISGFGADTSTVQQAGSSLPVPGSVCHQGGHRAPFSCRAGVPRSPARRRCPCAAAGLRPGVDAVRVGGGRDATGAALFFCGENRSLCSIICLLATEKKKKSAADSFPTAALPKRSGLERAQTQEKIRFILAAPRKQCQRQLPGPGPDLIGANEGSGKPLPLINISLSEPPRSSRGVAGRLFLRPFLVATFLIRAPALGKRLWTSMEVLPGHRMKSQPRHLKGAPYPRDTSFWEG